MKIEPKAIKVRDLAEGYEDNDEQGVRAYDGKLDVRPPYQREFVYKDAQRDAVIDTLAKGYPLNVMYGLSAKTTTSKSLTASSGPSQSASSLRVSSPSGPSETNRFGTSITCKKMSRSESLTTISPSTYVQARTARSWSGSKPLTSLVRN